MSSVAAVSADSSRRRLLSRDLARSFVTLSRVLLCSLRFLRGLQARAVRSAAYNWVPQAQQRVLCSLVGL